MRIYLDLDSRRLLTTPTRPLSLLEFKRRDNDSIELQFLRDAVVQQLPAGTTARVGIKPDGDYDADFLAVSSLTQTGTGTATVYSGELNLNTTAVAAAFAAEPDKVSAMLEVEWVTGNVVSSSKTLPTTLHNDVIRGDEGTPAEIPNLKANQAEAEAGTDNTKWMTPLRTAQAIAALGSGGGGGGGGVSSWNDLTDKPSTFPPEAHQHDLSDLSASGAASGQVPTWNGTSWVPQTPSTGGGGVTSFSAGTTGLAPSTATSGAVTLSGTLALANGGTGATTAAGALANLGAASSTHTHGNITTAGAIGTTSGLPVVTGASGVLTAGSFGTTSGTVAQGNHTHGNITTAGAIGTTSGLPIVTGASGVLQTGSFGTTSGTFCEGNDPRITANITSVGSTIITSIQIMTLADYSAITPSPNILYFIV